MAPAALLDGLAQALLDEERARSSVREAMCRQADLLRQLRNLGLPATRVAHRVAAAGGTALPLADRLRLAARLRKRAWRGTTRPADLARAGGLPAIPASPSDRAMTPNTKETNMPKLIKRTVVEEYIEDDVKNSEADEESEVEEQEGDGEEEDDDSDSSDRKR